MAVLSVWDYIVFGLMLFGSSCIGIYHGYKNANNKKLTKDDYLLASNQISWFPLGISLIATSISAVALLGFPAEVYTYGVQFFIYLFSTPFSILLGITIYLPVFRRLKIISVNEYLERRFSRPVRVLGCCMTIISNIFYLAVVLYTPSLALEAVAEVPLSVSLIITSIVCNIYTTLGGMRGVIWTDVFQTCVMLIGLIVIVALGTSEVGGFNKVIEAAERGGRLNLWNFDPSPFVRHTFWTLLVAGVFTSLPNYSCNQMLIQRAMSAKSTRDMNKAFLLNIPGAFIIGGSCVFSGLVMYAVYEQCDLKTAKKITINDQIVPYFLIKKLVGVHGVPGIFMASLFSAALSTASSGLNALAAMTYEDIISYYFPNLKSKVAVRVNMLVSFCYGMLMLALAFIVPRLGKMVIQLTFSIQGIFGCPYLGMFALGILFPWANSTGAIVGCLCGFAVTLWLQIGALFYPPNKDILPVSIAGCSDFNTTVSNSSSVIQTQQKAHEYPLIYGMSYLWYAGLSISICFLVGSIVSLLVRRKKELNRDLMFNYSQALRIFRGKGHPKKKNEEEEELQVRQ